MSEKLNVWIIDDDQINNLICKILLKEQEWLGHFHEFTNSREAMEQLKKTKNEELPDIILLDINMPQQSGWEFLEDLDKPTQLFTDNNRPCLVLLTSSIDEEDQQRAEAHPKVCGLISKPLNLDELYNICDNLMKVYSS